MSALLGLESVSWQMESHFVFLPLDISHPEGWNCAHELHFRRVPIIAIVQPRGSTLAQSHVFVTHEGAIGEAALLSYMGIAAARGAGVVAAQDEEYRRALEEAEANRRTAEQIDEDARNEADAAESQFAAIPTPQERDAAVTIRFVFPDNATRTRAFPAEAHARWLFAFARKFVHPRRLVLLTGFPLAEIRDDETAIGDICRDRSFIVTVDFDENSR
jgi:hypothetical protein